MADIANRFKENPILRPSDIRPSLQGLKIECLLNPGAFEYEDKIWLLLRVAERPVQKDGFVSLPVLEDGRVKILEFDKSNPDLDLSDPRIITYKSTTYLTTLSHLRLVYSSNGIKFTESGHPPIFGEGPAENYGIEDCRVTQIGKTYYLTYTAVSESGYGVGIMSTSDWLNFHRHGMIFPCPNKDCAILPEKINGQYWCLHRPRGVDRGGNHIWTSTSKDIEYWGKHKCIARTRKGMWDSERIGAGAAPVKTKKGWLEIYHGADANYRYCLGAMLLDLNDPSIVLARSQEPIMEPITDYERKGFFGNVVFTNGHIVNGDTITIYYGASDEVICGATFSIEAIIDTLKFD
jgi:beta-1,2-mannobiose phosphorylase / 1,2-beta-oligomannan phosphorylase